MNTLRYATRAKRMKTKPVVIMVTRLNPLIATLKPQSNGPSYSNAVIDTLAVDGWAVTFGTARRGLGRAAGRKSVVQQEIIKTCKHYYYYYYYYFFLLF